MCFQHVNRNASIQYTPLSQLSKPLLITKAVFHWSTLVSTHSSEGLCTQQLTGPRQFAPWRFRSTTRKRAWQRLHLPQSVSSRTESNFPGQTLPSCCCVALACLGPVHTILCIWPVLGLVTVGTHQYRLQSYSIRKYHITNVTTETIHTTPRYSIHY